MTKEHLGLALALKIPIIVIITKIDMAPENILKQTLEDIQKILKMKGTLSGEFFVGKLVKIANGFFSVRKICISDDRAEKRTLFNRFFFAGVRKMSLVVKNNDDLMTALKNLHSETVPIFMVSNVTGENLDLLRSVWIQENWEFLKNLKMKK